MSDTAIEWTDKTWNPTTGCDRVSPGCDHCYAMTLAPRLKAMGAAKYQRDGDPETSGPGFGITEHDSVLKQPLSWRKPAHVFVNSMSDLFHDGVSDGFIWSVFVTMAQARRHTFQVLTKRHGRMRSLLNRWAADGWIARDHRLAWNDLSGYVVNGALPNVWLGVSVEDQKRADLRIPALLDTPAAVRFLSCEPLLGPVNLWQWLDRGDPDADCTGCTTEVFSNLDVNGHDTVHYCTVDCPDQCPEEGAEDGGWCAGTPANIHPRLDWVIAGGESGPGARPMHPDWVRELRDACTTDQGHGAAFFFKQWGAWTTDRLAGRPNVLLGSDGTGRPAAHHNRPEVVEMWQAKGKHDTGRELDGRTWDEYPAVAS